MEVDPLEYVEPEEDPPTSATGEAERRKSRLNAQVAVTVALLATFLGICQVKAGNIAQAMQQAQAQANDHWAWYQFRKVRSELFQATTDQLRLQALSAPPAARPAYQKQIASYQSQAKEQAAKMTETEADARGFEKEYAALNVHDDQFDLSEAFLSIAIALLALTSLTQKQWLYALALLPTALGLLMGCAGLFKWQLQLGALSRLLS